uniref:Uncharacterized protein n=1 Tax=Rhizophora mucronata TaxID=61149 RepID=A0A2P2M1V5_RHIMU
MVCYTRTSCTANKGVNHHFLLCKLCLENLIRPQCSYQLD